MITGNDIIVMSLISGRIFLFDGCLSHQAGTVFAMPSRDHKKPINPRESDLEDLGDQWLNGFSRNLFWRFHRFFKFTRRDENPDDSESAISKVPKMGQNITEEL